MKTINITNPEKIIDKKSKATKFDVAKYYSEISSLILPHLTNRLLSVIRCHDNIKKECFFKKHPSNDKDMVELFNDEGQEYFYIKTKEQLIYQVQMGILEFHPWASNINKQNSPDVMIFDLDPAEKLPHEQLIQGVLDLKSILDKLHLQSFVKTSGGKGYHIVVPFLPTSDWNKFSTFASSVATLLESNKPHLYTTNIRKKDRKGKIFIDWLRNKRGSTCACAYSIRARENLPISFPIDWREIDKIKPNEIDINNYKLYTKHNPWKHFFEIKQKLK
ncbi:MAG: non-homologous end-joining DNA ligase [Clostridia bacterium]|nr:non-homologous end-joining DNA ligase [Clostridia bacterium]